MSDDELTQVWDWYQADPNGEALELLVAHYEPLARYLARRALAKAPAHQDREDLLSYAHHGLLDAIRRFEPGRGIKFETYASRRITGEIIDGLRKQDPLSRPMRKRVSAVRDAQRRSWDQLGRDATLEELAAEVGESVLEVRGLLVQQQTLNKELDETTTGTLLANQSEEVEREEDEIIVGLSQILPQLSERDRVLVLLYYCEKQSLRDTGKQLGVSDSRCAQIRREVLQAMLNR